MKQRGLSFEHEHPTSLALIQEMVGEKPAVASAANAQ
jgi:hypothetical protein